MPPTRPKRGLFAGMVTLDIIYRAPRLPGDNEKLMTDGIFVAAGGPATNAAVTFARLGGEAFLVGALGRSPVASVVREELQVCGVTVVDAAPDRLEPPPTASVVVNTRTGDRAVLGIPPFHISTSFARDFASGAELPAPNVILADGHQGPLAAALKNRFSSAPLVLDVGHPKPAFDPLWPLATYAVCSEDFRPAGCETNKRVFDYLSARGVEHAAITRGASPILYRHSNSSGMIPVEEIEAVDTTGAGDAFHGAFCFFILDDIGFVEALERAATEATRTVTVFGTRPPKQTT